MRRLVFLSMGILELALALVLIGLGWQVPDPAEVNQSFQSAGRVTDRASTQVRLFRQQVATLRRLEWQTLSARVQKQTLAVAKSLRSQSLDFETVATMRDALGDVGTGLARLAETLDPEALRKLGAGLGETAVFLDERVVPAAQQAADHLDASTADLRKDAEHLSAFLKEAPPDLKAIREVYKSLGRFREGLNKMDSLLKVQKLNTMREGFRGLEDALTSGSDEAERLGGYSYPVVTFRGLKPEVERRPFWPEGGKIAEGMRKAAAGASAANEELDAVAQDLPKIRTSLLESAALVDKIREGLGLALDRQAQIEPFLSQLPAHANRLAHELPTLGADLSRILRDTRRLQEVARALRQAQKGIENTLSRWPDFRRTLDRMAAVLQATKAQLDQFLGHRRDYEDALEQTLQVADTFAGMLPLVTDQLDCRLDEEERTLVDLGQSLDEVGAALPSYARTTSSLLQTGRFLSWLVAAIVGLHGCYLMLSVRMGRRYSL